MAIRRIDVCEKQAAENVKLAAEVRRRLAEHRTSALNLISAPGSGKTLLLERTLERLGCHLEIAVITGDADAEADAARLAACTGKLVQAVVPSEHGNDPHHLDARQIIAALEQIDLERTDLILIENAGTLASPGWDLGEEATVVLFSVCDGVNLPLECPRAFRTAEYVVINKTDLLAECDFDVERAQAHCLGINPGLRFFMMSALTGEGVQEWCTFLEAHARDAVVA